jgi:hypothetical protein
MGGNESRVKRGKTLSDADVTELSNLSGFTPQQVREWHSGFLVSKIFFFCQMLHMLSFISIMLNISYLLDHIYRNIK